MEILYNDFFYCQVKYVRGKGEAYYIKKSFGYLLKTLDMKYFFIDQYSTAFK
jgi:hypothetical protein